MNTMYVTKKTEDYELIDSGDGYKLERFGTVHVSRPDPQALWARSLSSEVWNDVSLLFVQEGSKGAWKKKNSLPDPWQMHLSDNIFSLKLATFKHVGIFPEQSVHWQWLADLVQQKIFTGKKVSVLNLFAYTGGASMSLARAGASVCHVDASESAVAWAKENSELSGLSEKPIRYIIEDVKKFVEREIRRGNTYDIIIMDPPTYGRGSKNEVWNIEEDLQPLIYRISLLLSESPVAVLLSGYASGYSHMTYQQLLSEALLSRGGTTTSGELYIEQSLGGVYLPCGISARWEAQ